MSINERISFELAKKRHIINLSFQRKSTLEKFRITAKLTIMAVLIWTLNAILANNLLEPRIISITNPNVVNTVFAVSEEEAIEKPEASEVSVQTSSIDIIREVFGDKAEEAIKIAQCESGLRENAIGDTHLSFEKGGEILGESYGLFQIRSGGKEGGGWSRPAKLGLTLEEFKQKMFDPRENAKYAKQMYDKGEWHAWSCKGVVYNNI